ncbi:hypothetical protein [Symbiobacterium terraclitae]|uniref:hypothetical protein n=1 Tax=Symbiobacterium terraclitae TaxID=557451 RepID=UPI0035B4FD90
MRRTAARSLLVLFAALACALAGAYLYPVGGRIWAAAQVSSVAMLHDGQRAELAEPGLVPLAARDALAAARLDRFRRLIPGIPAQRCAPLALALRKGSEWIDVRLRCTSGLLFDYIPREHWR